MVIPTPLNSPYNKQHSRNSSDSKKDTFLPFINIVISIKAGILLKICFFFPCNIELFLMLLTIFSQDYYVSTLGQKNDQ